MTVKTRNWLAALFILAFPFAVFVAFLIHDLNGPPSSAGSLPQPNSQIEATNAIPTATAAGTNPVHEP